MTFIVGETCMIWRTTRREVLLIQNVTESRRRRPRCATCPQPLDRLSGSDVRGQHARALTSRERGHRDSMSFSQRRGAQNQVEARAAVPPRGPRESIDRAGASGSSTTPTTRSIRQSRRSVPRLDPTIRFAAGVSRARLECVHAAAQHGVGGPIDSANIVSPLTRTVSSRSMRKPVRCGWPIRMM